MIEVRYRGGLGDWLFQYAFARLLASRWYFAMPGLPIPGMPATGGCMHGRRLLGPLEVLAGSACELLSSGTLLRPHNLQVPLEARVILHGWFQRVEYLVESEEHWGAWFRQEDAYEGDGSLALCLRMKKPPAWMEPGMHAGQSGPWPGLTPTAAAVARLLAAVQPRKVAVFSDGLPNPEISALLVPFGYTGEWARLDTPGTLRRLRGFHHIAGSAHHSFEWWAAQLNGRAEAWLHDPYPKDCRSSELTQHR